MRLALLLLAASALLAGDRALLIGVGNYADPAIPSLPGIDRDLTFQGQALRQLGIPPEAILTLRDSEATLARIRSGIRDWLAKGAGRDDRVVFYFSGHGSLSRDERDRQVSVLVPYDTHAGSDRLMNALSGPELGLLLAKVPSRKILIVADACHSGRMTDAARSSGLVAKFLRYPGMPAAAAAFTLAGANVRGVAMENPVNHILFAACRRDEVAGATPDGSLLTAALSRTVDRLVTAGSPVTMAKAQDLVSMALEANHQHPELSGDERLKEMDWTRPPGDWAFLQQVYQSRRGDVGVRISRPVYRVKERMTLEVDVPSDGYVNVVAMGANDGTAVVLFPNQFVQDNRVPAGVLRLPNNTVYELAAQPTRAVEENEMVVIFSTRELNLYREGTGRDVFRKLDETTRSTVVRQAAGYSAGFATFRITP